MRNQTSPFVTRLSLELPKIAYVYIWMLNAKRGFTRGKSISQAGLESSG
jgi:hypothetical protein